MRFPTRYKMVIGTFILAMIVLFDRILISVAKDPVSESLALSDKQMGWVLSVFALGYALFQTPSGILADRFGARRVLTAVVTIWSIFTALTGAAWNFISLLVIRFIFGVGEAGAFPSMAQTIYKWIPLNERGIVHGINFSGGRIGAAIALPIVAWLIEISSWQATFAILGLVGVIWGIIWYWWFRDDPRDHTGVSKDELAVIGEHPTIKREANEAVSFSKLFTSKTMWLTMGQYFCSNFTFFFCLTWLFPHLKAKYHLDALEAGFYSSAPLLFGALGNWFSGWWVDHIYRRGKLALSRKLPAIVGFSLAAIGVIGSVYMQEVTGAIIFISIAIFGADMTLSPSWATCVDIGCQNSGTVSGTMNMAGNLGSFFTALAFPYLLSATGSDQPFFFLTAGLNILAIPMWLALNNEKALDLHVRPNHDTKK